MRPPSPTLGVAIMLLMLVPTLVPLGTASPLLAPTLAPPPQELAALLTDLLLQGEKNETPPRSALDLLTSLGGPVATPESGGWGAYFSALQLDPTEDERFALRGFATRYPNTALAVEHLAGEVAAATRMREAALGTLTPDDWRALPRVVAVLTSEPSALTAADQALISKIDIQQMVRAAAILSSAAVRAQTAFPAAAALDAALHERIPDAFTSLSTLSDPGALIRAAVGDARPVGTEEPIDSVLATLALLQGAHAPTPISGRVPADLEAPLANLLVALARQVSSGEPATSAATLATFAAEMPALQRASYNLSAQPPGALLRMAGEPSPLTAMRSSGLGQPARIIEDLLGPATAPSRIAFVNGFSEFHAELGLPLSSGDLAAARELETTLDSNVSFALGSLLSAQARYQRDLSPASPLPSAARTLHASALPILLSDSPLSLGDTARLQASAHAQNALRSLQGERAGEVLLATLQLQDELLRANNEALATGILIDTGVFILLGQGDTTLTAATHPVAPALLVDLGGNDTYELPLAGVNATSFALGAPASDVSRTSIAIDLGGDDRYFAGTFSLGAAGGIPTAPTFALLIDVAGNDSYSATDAALGWGADGFGILVDVAGDDKYWTVTSGFAGSNATTTFGASAGIFLDASGDDDYHGSPGGFANLSGVGPTNAAVFIDLQGRDRYATTCAEDSARACFATPRQTRPGGPQGATVFVDVRGPDTYPRPGDDPRTTRCPCQGRLIVAVDATSIPLDGDADGDLMPDSIESLIGTDPEQPDFPPTFSADSDGDGFPDDLERVLGTDPARADDRPVSLPPRPSEIPNPSTVAPEAGPLLPSDGRSPFLVNLPGLLAIGLPGPTRYARAYLMTMDLGSDDNDLYLNTTAFNGFAFDFGGDDVYSPASIEDIIPPIAASTGFAAALIDLGGNDRYESEGMSQASAWGIDSLALLLDASGDDTYRAPAGTSQGYANDGGRAFFLDLGGDDDYVSPTQGVARRTSPPSAAIFVDAAGDDAYDHFSGIASEGWRTSQGAAHGIPPGSANIYETTAIAAFFDLSGRDVYIERSPNGTREDASDLKNSRLSVRPLDDRDGGAFSVFFDLDEATRDSDADGTADIVEMVVGTDAKSMSEAPTSGQGFLLNLPRAGIAIGANSPTTYTHDYALIIDQGGADVYRNRAGASSPSFPTSLLIDIGAEGDQYESTAATNISEFHALGISGLTALGSYPNLVLGSSFGAGVLGVGVLYDGGGSNVFNTTTSYTTATAGRSVVTAAQGAGILGVGVLAVTQGNASFVAEANALGPTATARTHAQGAGVGGVGILAVESATGRDGYTLRANSASNAATSGQGYGARGAGILLDGGGSNTFVADLLAQAVAESSMAGSLSTTSLPALSPWPVWSAQGSLGMLLLPGIGADTLTSSRQSQAFARSGGVALIFDAEGDDVRKLTPPLGLPAEGQAAVTGMGVAVIIDNRGNDRYTTTGTRAQAAADSGFAILVDLSGSDTYEARDRSQGHITSLNRDVVQAGSLAVGLRTPPPTAAVLFDRSGNDVYALTGPQPSGQGAVDSPPVAILPGNVWVGAPGVGAALFIDAGGQDVYTTQPRDQRSATPAQAPPTANPRERSADGNNWVWVVDPKGTIPQQSDPQRTTQQAFYGVGVDNDSPGGTYASLLTALSGFGVQSAHVEARTPAGAATPPLEGLVTLHAWLGEEGAADTTSAIDRAEFYFDGALITKGIPSNGTYQTTWQTRETSDDIPRYPDGHRTVTALIYPRMGTPDAADRRVAVDGEPFRGASTYDIDNPPLQREPVIAENVSTSLGPIDIQLRVDRDLEVGGASGPAGLSHIEPGPDEWAVATMADTLGIATPDPNCSASPCAPQFTVMAGGAGKMYMQWTPPQTGTPVVGYRIFRLDENSQMTPIGFVDARAPPRFVDSTVQGQSASYRIDALRISSAGQVRNASHYGGGPILSNSPAPATGLVASGIEGGIFLKWRASPDAAGYLVERAGLTGPWSSVATATDAEYFDTTAAIDITYQYRVTAFTGTSPGPRSVIALGKASPGHNVTMQLEGTAGTYPIVVDARMGGLWTHSIPYDAKAAGVPDGRYLLKTFISDARHEEPAVTVRTVTLDGTPPITSVGLPPVVGTKFVTSTGTRIPLSITEHGSGVAETLVYVSEDGGAWKAYDGYDPAAGHVAIATPADGATIRVIAISRDATGNVEGLTTTRPWTATPADALIDRIESGAWSTHLFDLTAPSGAGSELDARVKPGDAVSFWVRPFERGSGIRDAIAGVGPDRVPMAAQSDGTYAATWIASGVDATMVIVEVTDRAENVGIIRVGTITVDPDPPTIDEALILYSGGRSVGRAGDLATLRVKTHDALTPQGKLIVTADLGNVSSRQVVRLFWEGATDTYLVKDFPLDRLTGAQTANVTLAVTDDAGNRRDLTLTATVNGTRVAMTGPSVVNIAGGGATINWTTLDPARARIYYGPAPQLGVSTAPGPRGLNHSVTLSGLKPDTEYFAKAASASDAGVETLSDLFSFTTGPALTLTWTLGEGFPYARESPKLTVQVDAHDGSATTGEVDALLQAPRGSARLVGSAALVNGRASIVLDLEGVRDGDHAIFLRAADGAAGRGMTEAIPFVVDRSAPLVRTPARLVALPGQIAGVTVEERGSGLDLANVTWSFGGRSCAPFIQSELLSCIVPELGAANGTTTMRLAVPDRAGNVESLTMDVAIDGSAPVVRDAHLEGPVGLPHVAPENVARLSARIDDATIREVRADIGRLGGPVDAELRQSERGLYALTFGVVASTDGPVDIPLWAVDAAGRTTHAVVTAFVDSKAPVFLGLDGLSRTQNATHAQVAVRSDEPTRAVVRVATLAGGDAVFESKVFDVVHIIPLEGLRPGSTFRASVTLIDRAGHTTTKVVEGRTAEDGTPPTSVSALSVTDLGDGRVVLRWLGAKDDVGVESYHITRAVEGGRLVEVPLTSETSFWDTIAIGAAVRYTVAAVDYGGNLGVSASAEIRSTAVPHLSNGTVDPPAGGPGRFEYRVAVRDGSGTAPHVVVKVDGISHEMRTDASDCSEGCTYRAVIAVGVETLIAGPHRYSFHATSESFRAALPAEGGFVGPLVVGEAVAPTGLSAAARVPAFGEIATLAILLATAVAVGGAAWKKRRER